MPGYGIRRSTNYAAYHTSRLRPLGVAILHRLQQKLSHQLRWALGHYPDGAETSKNNPHNPNIPQHRDEWHGANVRKEGNVSDRFRPEKDVKFAMEGQRHSGARGAGISVRLRGLRTDNPASEFVRYPETPLERYLSFGEIGRLVKVLADFLIQRSTR